MGRPPLGRELARRLDVPFIEPDALVHGPNWVETPDDERALLWVLNQSEGRSSLLDIARDSGLPYPVIRRAAERLERAGLLAWPSSGKGAKRGRTRR